MRLISTNDLQSALNVSSRKEAIRKGKELGAVFHEGTGGFMWELETLPETVQLALLAATKTPALQSRIPQPEAILVASEKNRRVALARSSLIAIWKDSHETHGTRLEDFVVLYNEGQIGRGCKALLGEVSVPTFYRWTSDFSKGGVDAITPRYGNNKSGAGSKALTPLEQDIAKAMWLHPNKWTAAKVHREMVRCYGTTASVQTVARYLESIPAPIASFHRDGPSKFAAKNLMYIAGNQALYESMQMVVSDHHNWDFLVRGKDGKLFRPWITAFQDHRSRKFVGWAHSVYPSGISIAEGLYMLVSRFGAPETLHIDNGKDYRGQYLNGKSEMVTVENGGLSEETQVEIQGVLGALGVRVIFALPYHGQSKPIERHFGTFAQDFAKEFETYVGSNTVTRPEESQAYFRKVNKIEKKEVVYTFESYMAAWEAYVEQWNATWKHRGTGMEGRTPNEVFYENWRRKREVSPEYLEIAFAKTDRRVVQRDGVRIDGALYWGAELPRYRGASVLVKRTFAAQSRAMVFDLEGKFICHAEADYFAETGNLEADNDRVNAARKGLMAEIQEFSESIPELEEGKRGAIDFAQANRGMYAEPEAPEAMVIEKIANGYELPPPVDQSRLELVRNESEKPVKRRLRSSLDEDLE